MNKIKFWYHPNALNRLEKKNKVHIPKFVGGYPFFFLERNSMTKLITAACCIIGDEILSGKTKDTNSHYLGKNRNSSREKKIVTHFLYSNHVI